jgi:hypothetical protein
LIRTNKVLMIIVCFPYLAITSCQQIVSNLYATPVSDLPPMSIATLQSYSTPINVSEYSGQVTDGQLLLSVTTMSDGCSKAGSPIELVLVFKNLTDGIINLPANLSIAANRRGDGGDLIPFMVNADGVDVFTLADFQLVDIFNTPSNTYREIPANDSIDFTIEFRFPKYLAQAISSETIDFATPAPGQYFMRFVYSEYKRDVNTWDGAVGSNRFEICILN